MPARTKWYANIMTVCVAVRSSEMFLEKKFSQFNFLLRTVLGVLVLYLTNLDRDESELQEMSQKCGRWARHHQESFTNKKWTHLTKITFGSAVNCGRRFFCSVFQYVPRSFRAYYDFLSAAKSSEFISSTNGRMLKNNKFFKCPPALLLKIQQTDQTP